MALNSTTFRVQYTANGSTSAFSFPYLFLDETHLVVVETNVTTGVDTTKSLTTDYTVSGEGLAAGGTVTFLVNPTSGRLITISRIVPLTQLTDYNQSDSFPAESHEAALDKLTMIAQQMNSTAGSVDRSLHYKGTEPAGYVSEIPDIVDRKGTVPFFNETTGALEFADTAALFPTQLAEIAADVAAADASADAAAASESAALGHESAAAASETNAGLSEFSAAASAALAATYPIRPWVTATAYLVGNNVYESDKIYRCATSHTSGTFATDLAAVKWVELSSAGTALQQSNNLSDVSNPATARTNLGIAGIETFWVPAGAMTPRTTNGAAAGTVEMTTNKVMLKTFDFDAGTIEYNQFHARMPKSWDGGVIKAVPVWTAASGSGDVVWGVQALALSDDDAIDSAFGTAQEVTDTLTAANDYDKAPTTADITISGSPAPEDWVVFQVYRKATDGADTLGVDSKLIGITILYNTNETKDN